MNKAGAKEVLAYLDELNPPDWAWRDPHFVMVHSCLMYQAIMFRLGQRLIDSGYAKELPKLV